MTIKRKHNRGVSKRQELRAQRKARDEGHPYETWISHPLFGRVPRLGYLPDLDYQPPLPPGAIRGNPRKQYFCAYHAIPCYFYVDREFNCRDCGAAFGFSAEEQRFWYEELQFHLNSVPVCCLPCRRTRRTTGGLSAAMEASRERPEDPDAWLAVARATIDLARRQGRGNLERAIAAARQARRLAPDRPDPLYWEAACQETAGRLERAAAGYRAFLAAARGRPKWAELSKRAAERLAAITPAGAPASADDGAID